MLDYLLDFDVRTPSLHQSLETNFTSKKTAKKVCLGGERCLKILQSSYVARDGSRKVRNYQLTCSWLFADLANHPIHPSDASLFSANAFLLSSASRSSVLEESDRPSSFLLEFPSETAGFESLMLSAFDPASGPLPTEVTSWALLRLPPALSEELEIICNFVVVAASGNDLLETPMPLDRHNDGLREGVARRGDTRLWAEEMISDAAAPAAEILSLATWVTGFAFGVRGHVPPYQVFLVSDCDRQSV